MIQMAAARPHHKMAISCPGGKNQKYKETLCSQNF